VVVGRVLVLLVVEQLAQGGLLLGAALQHQQHALHRQSSRGSAQIELRARQNMRVALEHRQLGFIYRLGNKRPWRNLARDADLLRQRKWGKDHCQTCDAEQSLRSERQHIHKCHLTWDVATPAEIGRVRRKG